MAEGQTGETARPAPPAGPPATSHRPREDTGRSSRRSRAARGARPARAAFSGQLTVRLLPRQHAFAAPSGPAAIPVFHGFPAIPMLSGAPSRPVLAVAGTLGGPAVAGAGAGGTAVLPMPRRLTAPKGARARVLDACDVDLSARLRPALRMPRRRTLVLGVILGVPLALLAFRFRADVQKQLADVPTPNWPWLLLCGFGAVLYYVTNGVALRAGSGLPLGVRVSTAVQCAAAAANRIIPAGLGAIAVNLRFLERRGLARSAGLATIASLRVVCGLVHLAALALVAGLLGDSRITASLTGPLRDTLASVGIGPTCIVIAAVLSALGLLLARRGVRDRLRAPAATFLAHLRGLTHSPGRTAMLTTSLAGTKVAQVIALTASTRAFGGQVSVLSVAAVYLVGSAVAGAAPTAGNVGAIEPALAIGLTAAGGPAAAMVAAVLVYRLIGYWLPVIPGVIALTALRRRGDL
ncbi:lysylphosphatidylglycerol synthase transmembrane domain-containing protein [Pseudofrankia asymbiotica]|nr:lysylphosphatidylglycerol synthase domain-containing protein [Pseudofrankia asymbiotica]